MLNHNIHHYKDLIPYTCLTNSTTSLNKWQASNQSSRTRYLSCSKSNIIPRRDKEHLLQNTWLNMRRGYRSQQDGKTGKNYILNQKNHNIVNEITLRSEKKLEKANSKESLKKKNLKLLWQFFQRNLLWRTLINSNHPTNLSNHWSYQHLSPPS